VRAEAPATPAGAAFVPGPPRPARREAVGILGGTFDPVHYGHLAVAEYVREELGLATILFVPAGVPPHKPGRPISPAVHRLAMLELAVAGNPAFQVSRVEVDRPGPSYSVDTVDLLVGEARREGRTLEVTFVISVEALWGLPSWHEPQRLLDLCRLAVLPRGGAPRPEAKWIDAHFPGRAGRILFLPGPEIWLSASQIRALAAAGRSIRYLVPPAVAEYIAGHRLYRPEEGASRG
jgi:nicotinate-nucleotide adenylyltransferase